MIPYRLEEQITPTIRDFIVNDLQGRYDAYCDDTFLMALMIHSISRHDCRSLEDIVGNSYHSVVYIFASILEHKCRAGGNGHHVAQRFQEAMNKLLEA